MKERMENSFEGNEEMLKRVYIYENEEGMMQ